MDHCCQNKSADLEKLSKLQSRTLWIVLGINIFMFFLELVSGYLAHSLSLMGDSLDMLGDAVAYGSSLWVIHKSIRWKAKSAMLKGGLMLTTAALILGRAIYQFIHPEIPDVNLMSLVGVMALLANLICLRLLTRHKDDDINMSSVWICSRNDIIANTSVLLAAGLVFLSQSPWPDIIVGIGLAALFTRSALSVLFKAKGILSH